MKQIAVKPSKPGLLVRNPQRNFRPIHEDGELVVLDSYIARRISDGDLIRTKLKSDGDLIKTKLKEEDK